MGQEHFHIKKGDTRPELQVTLKDGNGNAVNVTGATVKFSMRDKETGTVKVNKSAVTLVTPASGIVKYTWAAADTDTAGEYEGEFEVTYAGSGIETFPNSIDNRLNIHILEEIA